MARHPQLQALDGLVEAPSGGELFDVFIRARLADEQRSPGRIGVVLVSPGEAPLREEYVLDFAHGVLRGGDEWAAVQEDPDLDAVVELEASSLHDALTRGRPPGMRMVRGDPRAITPLVALLRRRP